MESRQAAAERPCHKVWRRLVKKLRRKRIRQKAAKERDEEEQRLQLRLEQDPCYLRWKEEQAKEQLAAEKREKEEHDKLEEAWLQAEEKAQKEWQALQIRKAKARELQLAQEEILRKEYEEMQDTHRKKKEAERRRRDEQKKVYERMKKDFDAYIDDGARTPRQLRNMTETQPGKEICPFFNKTGACRYGDICSRNHQRPGLSTVVLVPNFYTHYSLDRHDYDSDARLEYDHRETRSHFRDFYFDVVPELEKFGKIKTLQYCKNTEPHLRGNLYIEYCSEREAASALRGLKGRWYAGRQLHCEFVNLKSWRGAICGMVRCPKGSACNFLHVFRNPTEDYGVKSPPLWQKRQEMFDSRGSSSSRRGSYGGNRRGWEDQDNGQDRRNWRWSESPERDDRRGGRSNFRPMQRGFNQRRGFDNRGGFDRRNDNRNFYNNRQPRRFDNRGRFSDDERGPRRRRDRRSRSRSGSRSMSRSMSRSRSRSRSGSRSPSRSMSRSMSRSRSRSKTRSHSPLNPEAMIEVDVYNASKTRDNGSMERESRSPSRDRKQSRDRKPSKDRKASRRPPSPKASPRGEAPTKTSSRKPVNQPPTKWDTGKREPSEPKGRDSRSASPPQYKEKKNDVDKHSPREQHRHTHSSKSGNSKNSSKQNDYEWDTTDSDRE